MNYKFKIKYNENNKTIFNKNYEIEKNFINDLKIYLNNDKIFKLNLYRFNKNYFLIKLDYYKENKKLMIIINNKYLRNLLKNNEFKEIYFNSFYFNPKKENEKIYYKSYICNDILTYYKYDLMKLFNINFLNEL